MLKIYSVSSVQLILSSLGNAFSENINQFHRERYMYFQLSHLTVISYKGFDFK